jgi:hypothetical protein
MNIKLIFATLSCAATVLVGCSDNYNIDEPDSINQNVVLDGNHDIDPTTGAYIVSAGENLVFKLEGDQVDNLLFYSGEIGYEYRYRNRDIADSDATIVPTISLTSSIDNINKDVPAMFRFMTSNNLSGYTNDAVAKAQWNVSPTYIRKGNFGSSNPMTQYYYPNLGLMDKKGLADDYSGWKSKDSVVFAIAAQSNHATYNRLILSAFNVVNTETRDYSYVLNGDTVKATYTKDYQLIKDMSCFDTSYRMTNTSTSASWASYNPLKTLPIGAKDSVEASRWYIWNVGQMGLQYGQGSGSPWVKQNIAGQDIRTTYNIEVFEPVKNIIVDGVNGQAISTPTEALKAEPSESWIISRMIYPRQVERDEESAIIKKKTSSQVDEFKYSYGSIGLYTVTFVINNQNKNKSYNKIQEMKIIVR